ncbi:MAG: preprotein translocase subunit YajC [Candidatus Krumholzibacteriia bacterium]
MNGLILATGGAAGGPQFGFMFVILATFAIFYFILIRPQQKKQKQLQKTIEALKKGDRIMTNGGIFGTVSGIKDNILVLKIADDVKIELLKSAVASVVAKNE